MASRRSSLACSSDAPFPLSVSICSCFLSLTSVFKLLCEASIASLSWSASSADSTGGGSSEAIIAAHTCIPSRTQISLSCATVGEASLVFPPASDAFPPVFPFPVSPAPPSFDDDVGIEVGT